MKWIVFVAFSLSILLLTACYSTDSGVSASLDSNNVTDDEVVTATKLEPEGTVSAIEKPDNEDFELIRPEGYWNMDIWEKYVVDVKNSEEFKELTALYRKELGGPVNVYTIPQWETLKGFKEKVEESISRGYSVLPEAYGIKMATSWMGTPRMDEIVEKYKQVNPRGIPFMQIGGISIDELEELVDESVKQNKDLVREFFGW